MMMKKIQRRYKRTIPGLSYFFTQTSIKDTEFVNTAIAAYTISSTPSRIENRKISEQNYTVC